jgi:uncharacterized membrane protein YqgA involved in biofilm formation
MEKLFKLLDILESPEAAGEHVADFMETYKPVIYSVIGELFGVYKDLNDNDEFFAERARSKKKLFEAYIAAGFTREEALLFLVDGDLKRERTLAMLWQPQTFLSKS